MEQAQDFHTGGTFQPTQYNEPFTIYTIVVIIKFVLIAVNSWISRLLSSLTPLIPAEIHKKFCQFSPQNKDAKVQLFSIPSLLCIEHPIQVVTVVPHNPTPNCLTFLNCANIKTRWVAYSCSSKPFLIPSLFSRVSLYLQERPLKDQFYRPQDSLLSFLMFSVKACHKPENILLGRLIKSKFLRSLDHYYISCKGNPLYTKP